MFFVIGKVLSFIILVPFFLFAFIAGSINSHATEQDLQTYRSNIEEWENFRALLEKENIRFVSFGECKRLVFKTAEVKEYVYMADPLNVECGTGVNYEKFDQSGEYKWSTIKENSEKLLPTNDVGSIEIEDLWSDGIDSMNISFKEERFGGIVGLLYETREGLRHDTDDLYHKRITDNWFATLYHPSPF